MFAPEQAVSDPCLQTAARSLLGETVTAFDRISDCNGVTKRGDVVHISTKPAILGEIQFFAVEKVFPLHNFLKGGF